jgi:fructose-specific phosphotransferase system IIA component
MLKTMNLTDILSTATIRVPLKAADKRAAINELVDVLSAAGKITSADKLKDVVWEREQQRTTGIGEGLAIPHGKCNCSKELVMAIGIAATPIDFQSVDKKPVQMIVLLASPPDKTADHIQALGKISRLMSDAGFRAKAFAAKSAEELYGLFKTVDG